jgi:hypothetical protein
MNDRDETLSEKRRSRAIAAVSRLRARARETGRDKLSQSEINREIQAARRRP